MEKKNPKIIEEKQSDLVSDEDLSSSTIVQKREKYIKNLAKSFKMK